MLRPAGPRISSMMPTTRSGGRYWCSSRSVAPGRLPLPLARLLAARERRDDALDLHVRVGGRRGHSVSTVLGGLLVQPLAHDGDGFVRIALGEVADLLHRLRVHLALYLG